MVLKKYRVNGTHEVFISTNRSEQFFVVQFCGKIVGGNLNSSSVGLKELPIAKSMGRTINAPIRTRNRTVQSISLNFRTSRRKKGNQPSTIERGRRIRDGVIRHGCRVGIKCCIQVFISPIRRIRRQFVIHKAIPFHSGVGDWNNLSDCRIDVIKKNTGFRIAS